MGIFKTTFTDKGKLITITITITIFIIILILRIITMRWRKGYYKNFVSLRLGGSWSKRGRWKRRCGWCGPCFVIARRSILHVRWWWKRRCGCRPWFVIWRRSILCVGWRQGVNRWKLHSEWRGRFDPVRDMLTETFTCAWRSGLSWTTLSSTVIPDDNYSRNEDNHRGNNRPPDDLPRRALKDRQTNEKQRWW